MEYIGRKEVLRKEDKVEQNACSWIALEEEVYLKQILRLEKILFKSLEGELQADWITSAKALRLECVWMCLQIGRRSNLIKWSDLGVFGSEFRKAAGGL